MNAVVADGSTAEEQAVRAGQPVIVQGGHNGNPLVPAGIQHTGSCVPVPYLDSDSPFPILTSPTS